MFILKWFIYRTLLCLKAAQTWRTGWYGTKYIQIYGGVDTIFREDLSNVCPGGVFARVPFFGGQSRSEGEDRAEGGGLVRHLCYSTTLEQTSGRCSAAAPRPPHRRKERLKFLLSFVCYMSRGVFSKSATSVKKPIPHFSMFPQSFPPSKSRISLILVPHRNASLWEVGSKIEHGISHVDQGKRHRIDGDVQNTNFKAKTRQFRPWTTFSDLP